MKMGFTGTREGLTKGQRDSLWELLKELKPTEAHHGCCAGADTEFVIMLAQTESCKLIVAHPCDLDPWTSDTAKEGSDEVLAPLPPLDRNRVIVLLCDLLVACPAEAEEQLRSGTWSTIRHARKAGKPVKLMFPDGTVKG